MPEPKYVKPFLDQLNPDEEHNVGGDCINPKCDYEFSHQDAQAIMRNHGWFTCPKCDQSYNYWTGPASKANPGGMTRGGLTMRQMGQLGEQIVQELGVLPGIGTVTWVSPDYNSPIDAVIGDYACEIKTNHSEATARFKLGGRVEVEQKRQMAEQLGKTPALVGVRLNFYKDTADIFFRPQLTDTWIGNEQMQHVAKVNFHSLNPYKNPGSVAPVSQLPDDDGEATLNEFPF